MSRLNPSDQPASVTTVPPLVMDNTNYGDYLLDEDEDEEMMDGSEYDDQDDDVYVDEDDEDDIDEDDEDNESDEEDQAHRNRQHHNHGHGHPRQQQQQTSAVATTLSTAMHSSTTAAAPPVPKEEQAQQSQVDLRKQIILIQQDPKISSQEKAKKIQELMTSKWSSRDKGKTTRASLASNKLEDKRQDFNMVLNTDKNMTYHDKSSNIVGCKHYQRAAKLQAHCCGKWYTCRFCHDEVSDHNIIRNLITTMMCMHCSTVQPAGQDCINVDCQKRVAKYYCKECKLWDDDPRKNIYHCYDCGICRIGKGLGQDYFHCKKCNVCMAISLKGRHKCIERNLESDCPICGEYMFTSTTTVIFMPCGHCIHYKCHQEYIQTSYQCPTCFKSLANMSEYFKRIDAMLAQHQMPPEYNKTQTFIYCNDCEKKCYAKFHFLYHKCIHCKGYNTKVLQTMEMGEGTTVESNNATLLASAANLAIEELKVNQAKEIVSCCGGSAGDTSESASTLVIGNSGSGSHAQLTHSHSHHSILSHRSSVASLHGVQLGSTAPVFSSSSASLHSNNGHANLSAQHSFASLPQTFSQPSLVQNPQLGQQPAPILPQQQQHQHQQHQQHHYHHYPHQNQHHQHPSFNAGNNSSSLIGGPMNLQQQYHHAHQHPNILPSTPMVQQQQQNRYNLGSRSVSVGGSSSQPLPSTFQQQLTNEGQHTHQQQQQYPNYFNTPHNTSQFGHQ
ncbi:UNVERIFIED_CONTAM: hypothetical protein HDU68_010739 [Siphonaria sp. JEL0065]|nr:hypothetical protein HDU68_010739 [Siphonaria sp. JEL0065]